MTNLETPAQIEAMKNELAQLRAEMEGLRIALTWLAPFVQMDAADQAGILQAAREEAAFGLEAGTLGQEHHGQCLTVAVGVLTQAGVFCRGSAQ